MPKKPIKSITELPKALDGHMLTRSCPYQDVWLHCSHRLNNAGWKLRKQKPDCKYKDDVDKCPLYKQWKRRNSKFEK